MKMRIIIALGCIVAALCIGAVAWFLFTKYNNSTVDGPGMVNVDAFKYFEYSHGGGEFGEIYTLVIHDDVLDYTMCEGNGYETIQKTIPIDSDTYNKIMDLLADGNVRSWTELPKSEYFAYDAITTDLKVEFADGRSIHVANEDMPPTEGWANIKEIVGMLDELATREDLNEDLNDDLSAIEVEDLTTPEDSAKLEIFNNGHYFVKIQDKVYFREYGTRALENPTIFGDYLLTPTGDSSHIDYYDEKTGETVRAFEDFGFGNIAFLDPVLFMNGLDFSASDYGTPYIYGMDRSGAEINLPERIHGVIKGTSNDNEMLFYENTYVGNEYQPTIGALTCDGNKAFTIESDNVLKYLGCVDNYLIYAEIIYEIGELPMARIWSRNIYSDEAAFIFEMQCEVGDSLDFGDLFDSNGTKYIPVLERAGSGSMFQRGILISYEPSEGNGKVVAEFHADEYDETPYVNVDGVERSFFALGDDKFYIKRKSYEDEGDLCRKQENGNELLEVKDLIPAADYYEIRKDMTLAEMVDETGYIMLATQVYDEEGSIGWRDGFRMLKMEYVRLNGDGTYDVINTVDYE